MKLPISLLVIAKNHQHTIDFCIGPLARHVQEVFVCDTGSTDRTMSIAKKRGAKIVRIKMTLLSDWAGFRNELLKYASSPWILFLDVDERIAPRDILRLRPLLERKEVDAYRFPRRNYSNGLNFVFGWDSCRGAYRVEERFAGSIGYYTTRRRIHLFRNLPGMRFTFPIHESLEPAIRANGYRVREVGFPVHHFELHWGLKAHKEKRRRYLPYEQRMIRLFPRHAEGYVHLICDLLLLEHGLPGAERLSNRLTQLIPRDARAWILKGIVKMELGKLTGAVVCFWKAAGIQKTPESLYLLGWARLRQKKFQSARSLFRAVLRRQPRNPFALNLMGVAAERAGGKREAIRYFSRALSIHPGFQDARYNRGVLYERLGKIGLARRDFQAALAFK